MGDTAGDETAGDEAADDETAGEDTAGDDTAGDETAGDGTADDETAGDEAGKEAEAVPPNSTEERPKPKNVKVRLIHDVTWLTRSEKDHTVSKAKLASLRRIEEEKIANAEAQNE